MSAIFVFIEISYVAPHSVNVLYLGLTWFKIFDGGTLLPPPPPPPTLDPIAGYVMSIKPMKQLSAN